MANFVQFFLEHPVCKNMTCESILFSNNTTVHVYPQRQTANAKCRHKVQNSYFELKHSRKNHYTCTTKLVTVIHFWQQSIRMTKSHCFSLFPCPPKCLCPSQVKKWINSCSHSAIDTVVWVTGRASDLQVCCSNLTDGDPAWPRVTPKGKPVAEKRQKLTVATLTLDRVIWYIAMRHSSTNIYTVSQKILDPWYFQITLANLAQY